MKTNKKLVLKLTRVTPVQNFEGHNLLMVSGALEGVPALSKVKVTLSRILPGLNAQASVGEALPYRSKITQDGAHLAPDFHHLKEVLGSDIQDGLFWFGRAEKIALVEEKLLAIFEEMLKSTSADFMKRRWDNDLALVRYDFPNDYSLFAVYGNFYDEHEAFAGENGVKMPDVLFTLAGSETNDLNLAEILVDEMFLDEVFWNDRQLVNLEDDEREAANETIDICRECLEVFR